MLAYNISACEVCIIWRKPTEALKNPSQIAESRTGTPAMVTLKIQSDCFTVHYTTLLANTFVRSHLGCGTDSVSIRFAGLTNISKTQKRCKSTGFWNLVKFDMSIQSTPQTTGILTKLFCTSGPNLVVLAWTGEELLRRQAQNGVNFDFEVKFDLEGQGQ